MVWIIYIFTVIMVILAAFEIIFQCNIDFSVEYNGTKQIIFDIKKGKNFWYLFIYRYWKSIFWLIILDQGENLIYFCYWDIITIIGRMRKSFQYQRLDRIFCDFAYYYTQAVYTDEMSLYDMFGKSRVISHILK